MEIKLRLTKDQQTSLKAHLYPDKNDNNYIIATCGKRLSQTAHCFMINNFYAIDPAIKLSDRDAIIDKAVKNNQAILQVFNAKSFSLDAFKLENHNTVDFSKYYIHPTNHASMMNLLAVMFPDGHIQAYELSSNGEIRCLSLISIIGDDLEFWSDDNKTTLPELNFTQSHGQAFGAGTTKAIEQLAIAVIGCSGTGSPVVEQLARLGVGKLVLVDPDHVEERNLNRILNSTYEDAILERPKVDVLSEAVKSMGLDTKVTIFAKNLCTPEVIKAVAECDIIFGCMDGVEGRHLLNILATYYLIPYIDIGVKLIADGKGNVSEVSGCVHYLQPGKSSLLSRGVFTLEQVRAESIKRTDPNAYNELLESKYIVGAYENSPAVISINMLLASMGVNEFLARLHPYRNEPNSKYAEYRISINGGFLYNSPEREPCKILMSHIGRGDVSPLLGKPSLSESEILI